jgi:glutaredoxin
MWAVSGQGTTPQVFIDGKHIGGADALAVWLAAK